MELGIIIAQLVLKYGPELAGQFVEIIHSGKPVTAADWHALLSKVSGKSYDDYLNAAKVKG